MPVRFSLILVALLAACSPKPTPVAAAPAPTEAAVEVADADVTARVRAGLLGNEGLKGFDIAVASLKGDVRLTGVVDSQAQKDQAVALVRGTDGVHSVHDELTIKP